MTKLNLQRIKQDQYGDGAEIYDVLKNKHKYDPSSDEQEYTEPPAKRKKVDYSENRKVKRGEF